MKCFEGNVGQYLIQEVQNKCDFGNGRQCLTLVSDHYLLHSDEAANIAATQMLSLRCQQASDLETYVSSFQAKRILAKSVPDAMCIELIREGISGVPELRGLFYDLAIGGVCEDD